MLKSASKEITGCIFLSLCGFNLLNNLQNAVPHGLRLWGERMRLLSLGEQRSWKAIGCLRWYLTNSISSFHGYNFRLYKNWLFILFFVGFFGFFRRNPRQILTLLRYSYLRHFKHLVLAEPGTVEANTQKCNKIDTLLLSAVTMKFPFQFSFLNKMLPFYESRAVKDAEFKFTCSFPGWDVSF